MSVNWHSKKKTTKHNMNILFIIIEAKKLVACNINSLPLRVMYNITMGPKKIWFWIHHKYFGKFPKDVFPYFFTGIVKDFLFLSRTFVKVYVLTILQYFWKFRLFIFHFGPLWCKMVKIGAYYGIKQVSRPCRIDIFENLLFVLHIEPHTNLL